MKKKIIALTILGMFLLTSFTTISAVNTYEVKSITNDSSVTEKFLFCFINSSGRGVIKLYPPSPVGTLLFGYEALYFGYEATNLNATTTIKTLFGQSLTVKGEHYLKIKGYFLGRYATLGSMSDRQASLTGIASRVEITYENI